MPIITLVRSGYRSNLISISGGIIGFSSSEVTMQRWAFTSHTVAELRSNIGVDFSIKKGSKKPKDLQKSRIKYGGDMVSKCCDLFKHSGHPCLTIPHALYRYHLVLMLQLR